MDPKVSEILKLQMELAEIYKYKEHLSLAGARDSLYSNNGLILSNGYDRIVIGDYGAFIEISALDIVLDHITVQQGQEFRISDPQFKDRVKYHWLTAKDNSHCKIYFQQRTVDYADYKPGFYYISPYEVKTERELSLNDKVIGASVIADNALPNPMFRSISAHHEK